MMTSESENSQGGTESLKVGLFSYREGQDGDLARTVFSIGDSPRVLRLRSLPGASALHLIYEPLDGVERRRVEIPVDGLETLEVSFVRDGESDLRVSCPGRSITVLPDRDEYGPKRILSCPASPSLLDLVVLVDGTTRLNLDQRLLEQTEVWQALLDQLEVFLTVLAQTYGDQNSAVLAFGDQPMPTADVKADELQPRYHIYPRRKEDRKIRAMSVAEIGATLSQIPVTSGGDFVDALADGLGAVNELRFRPGARKLLLVFGDSPGYSIEHPISPGADLCVRHRDVDVEAMRLHEQGIEIMTIYHDPSGSEIGLERLSGRELLEDARLQYQRLASLPAFAFAASSFDPERAAESVLSRPPVIARGAAYGILLAADAENDQAEESIPVGDPENGEEVHVR